METNTVDLSGSAGAPAYAIRGALLSQNESESNDVLIGYFRRFNIGVDCFHLFDDILVPERRLILSPRLGRSFSMNAYQFCYGRTWGDSAAKARLHSWLRTFADLGIPALDPLIGVQNNDDKIQMVRVFERAGIPTPATIILNKRSGVDDAIRKIRQGFRGDVVVKANGSGGRDVHFVSATREAQGLRAAIERYTVNGMLNEGLIVQQYVPSKDARNCSYHYRALLVNGQLVGAMRFKARDPSILASNVTQGGNAEIVPTSYFSETDRQILKRAAEAMEINIAGVDFLKTSRSDTPMILEVNNSPGLYTAYTLGMMAHLGAIVAFVILTESQRWQTLHREFV